MFRGARPFLLLGWLACAAGSPIVLSAQSASGTIRGTVVDPHGGVVPGATIVITSRGTNQQRQAVAAADGFFTFVQLPPTAYVITATLDGFAPSEPMAVTVNVGDERLVRVALRLAGLETVVEVRPERSRIQDSAAVGTVIGRELVENMPLSGRSFQSLFDLTPGVMRTAVGTGGQFVVNGQRPDANYYLVDGVSANVNMGAFAGGSGAAGTLPSLSVLNTTNTLVQVDALQEFRILTSSYAPEFGRTPGGQVTLVTRSGSNRFTGSAFEYFRHEKMEANDWFARRNGLAKPPTRQHDFGGVLGGPVTLPGYDGRNRTFFFASYEALRLKQPQVANTVVPSIAARQRANPTMRAILDVWPRPTGPELLDEAGQPTGAAAYAASYADPSEHDTFNLRVDQTVGVRGTAFFRYSSAPSRSRVRSAGMGSVRTTERNTRTATAAHTWTSQRRVSNDLRVNLTYVSASTNSRLDTFGGATPVADDLVFPPFASQANASLTFQMDFGALFPSFTVGTTADNSTRQFNIVDSFLVSAGTHAFKFGVDYRRLDLDLVSTPSISPNFPTLAQFYTGVVPSLSITARQPDLRPVLHNLSLYAQDTWRASSRLSLTYGLRWDLNPAPTERSGKRVVTVVGMDSPDTLALADLGTPLFPTRYDSLAPRVGATYQLGRRAGWETTLKSGAGLYYDLGTALALVGYEGYPYRITQNYPDVRFPLGQAADAIEPAFSLEPPYTTTYGFDPAFVAPRTWQWNATVDQMLGSRQSVSIAYVGAAGRRLTRAEMYRRPNPLFSDSVSITRNSASSDYRSLQLQYVQRLFRGVQGTVAYTLSHATDTASSGTVTTNVPVSFAGVEESRADSDFDVRHNLAAALSYDLPAPRGSRLVRALLGGFSVDALVKARSAPPVTLTGRQLAVPFGGALRPDIVAGQPLYVEDATAPGGRRFNPSAFVLSPADRQGTLGRNALRGFGASQVDVALRRQIPLSHGVRLQLRGELFNLFNTANFGNPTTSITSPQFGRATTMLNRALGGLNALYETGGPRSGQLAVKILF